MTFKYDPFGRRIQKTFGSSTTNYVYDGDNLIEDLDSAGTVLARYTLGLGIDETLADVRGGQVSFYEVDGLGSTTSLTNADGAEVARYGYDSFGNLIRGTVIGRANTFSRYTGRQFDAETGLYYYRARYYDSTVGRLISEDPIQFNAGTNFYTYVDNDPANEVDPSGSQAQPVPIPTPAPVPPPRPFLVPPPPMTPAPSVGSKILSVLMDLAGNLAGAALMILLNPTPVNEPELQPNNQCKDDHCDKILKMDLATCWSLRNKQQQEVCVRQAYIRYSECLAHGEPRSPLSWW